jgi:aryl-alcohol dehydrogenase-like predicted oxidoreductase
VSMQPRALGSTGLVVTPIGLGLAALGRPAYITLGRDRDLGEDRSVSTFEQRCHEMLDAAHAAGIRYIDAARSYGLAEQFLGSWLTRRRLPGSAMTIGSKWGYTYTGQWKLDAAVHERKDLSLGALQRQLQESRALLGDRLNLYQIHSATIESGVLDDRRVLAELARLRSEGLAVGLSVSGPHQAEVIRRALVVDVDGLNPFQSVQATWNLLERSAGAALAEARAQGLGVIVKESLANGRLTDPHAGDEVLPLRRQAQALGATLDALAVSAVLSQPWVDIVLSGAVTPDQLRSHLSALELPANANAWPGIAETPGAYWKRRGTFTWQ